MNCPRKDSHCPLCTDYYCDYNPNSGPVENPDDEDYYIEDPDAWEDADGNYKK
jgi:hypothetical protein